MTWLQKADPGPGSVHLGGIPITENRSLPVGTSYLMRNLLGQQQIVTSHAYALKVKLELQVWLRDQFAEVERKWFG